MSWARDVTTWVCDRVGMDELYEPAVCKRVAGDGAGGEPDGEELPFDSERRRDQSQHQ